MNFRVLSIISDTLKLFEDNLSFSALSPAGMIAAMASSLVCGIIIYLVYRFCYRGVVYSDNFNILLVMITSITGFIIMTISSNVVLSLGMVGALSIVRFRTAIKDSRDTVYIFWTVIVGICCGVGDYMVALIGSAITFIVLFILGCIKNDNRMLIIVRGARNKQSIVTGYIFNIFKNKAILRVKNTTEDTMELIYEVSSSLLKKTEKDISITDGIYDLGGIEYVNIVMQNDEISN